MRSIRLCALLTAAFVPQLTFAHCPLCTAGAGLLAGIAASLGVSSVIIGVLIGAFAAALSTWLARLPTRTYVPYQRPILIVLVFVSTVIPIMPLIRHYAPLYVSLGGDYGTLFHNTYTIDLFLAGVPIGVVALLLAPRVSKYLTRMRGGRQVPFQGMGITFALLLLISLGIQFAL